MAEEQSVTPFAPRGTAVLLATLLAAFGLVALSRPLWSPSPPDREATENAVSMIAVSDPLLVGHALDINAATPAELDLLPGIGKVLAERIVEERDAHGPYRDPDDLARRVVGVGDDLARSLAPHVRFEP